MLLGETAASSASQNVLHRQNLRRMFVVTNGLDRFFAFDSFFLS